MGRRAGTRKAAALAFIFRRPHVTSRRHCLRWPEKAGRATPALREFVQAATKTISPAPCQTPGQEPLCQNLIATFTAHDGDILTSQSCRIPPTRSPGR